MQGKESLVKVLEAILFASGKWLSLEELQKLSRTRDPALVEEALRALQEEHASRSGSFQLEHDGDRWKFHVAPSFLPYVRKVVTQTELSKSVLETLAILAVRAPVTQSEVIHIRTNKAYDHLSLLEQSGYISRKKQGRTKLISLAEKFFDYFDIPREALQERFRKVQELEGAVVQKEKSVEEKFSSHEKLQEEFRSLEELRKADALKALGTATAEVEELKAKLSGNPSRLGSLEVVEAAGDVEVPKTPVVEENSAETIPKEETPPSVEESSEAVTVEEQSSSPEKTEEVPETTSSNAEHDSPVEEQEVETSTVPTQEVQEQEEKEKTSEEKPSENLSQSVLSLSERLEKEAVEASKALPSKEGKGLFSAGVSPDVQKIVDKKVNSLLSGVEESDDSSEEK